MEGLIELQNFIVKSINTDLDNVQEVEPTFIVKDQAFIETMFNPEALRRLRENFHRQFPMLEEITRTSEIMSDHEKAEILGLIKWIKNGISLWAKQSDPDNIELTGIIIASSFLREIIPVIELLDQNFPFSAEFAVEISQLLGLISTNFEDENISSLKIAAAAADFLAIHKELTSLEFPNTGIFLYEAYRFLRKFDFSLLNAGIDKQNNIFIILQLSEHLERLDFLDIALATENRLFIYCSFRKTLDRTRAPLQVDERNILVSILVKISSDVHFCHRSFSSLIKKLSYTRIFKAP